MKKKMEINQLKEMVDDAFKVLMINPTKIIARIREFMFHIDYKIHQSIDLSMDLEIKAKGLFLKRYTEIYDRMKKWGDLFKNKM